MTLLDLILQHFNQQQGQPPQMQPPVAQPPVAMVPPDATGAIPVAPVVQALTNGGGMLNRIKNAKSDRQQALDALSNL